MSHTPRILILDDEVSLVDAISRHFQRQGYETSCTFTVAEAQDAIERSVAAGAVPFDAILTDLQLPDGDGRSIVRLARAKLPGRPVVVMTGSRSISGAVESIRLGALTVVEKPFELQALEAEIRQAMAARPENEKGLDAAGQAGIVGTSAAIRQAFELLVLAAPTDATVLIEGETGTGKELVARALHRLSRRSQGPFVPVNCAALPESLAESELFGHAKGAFTGADRAHKGLFQQADGGTLLLDEIGEMPHPLQVKLLRALQEHEIQPLGAERPQRLDVRVVAATNRGLAEAASARRFRSDLYYRLAVVTIQLPALRDRPEDVPALVAHFLRGTPGKLGAGALEALRRYSWPGNVREMENVLQRLAVLKPSGAFELEDLPDAIRGANPALQGTPPQAVAGPIDLPAVLAELEDRLILQALEQSGGNKSQAARNLGLNRTTLIEKLRRMTRGERGN